jgi:hypothetical protein
MPHYLRFARALLVVSGAAASVAACGNGPPGTGGTPACSCPTPVDAAAGADVVVMYSTTPGAACTADQLDAGCRTQIPIGGPLAPPDLAAA